MRKSIQMLLNKASFAGSWKQGVPTSGSRGCIMDMAGGILFNFLPPPRLICQLFFTCHFKFNGKLYYSRIPRCPRTAPAKSTKDGDHKLSTISTIRQQKIKSHPISSLRSTPITKPRIAETPSNKKCQPCEEKASRVIASANSIKRISELCSGLNKLKIGIPNQTLRQPCRSQKSGSSRGIGLIQPKSYLTNGKIGKDENFTYKEKDDTSSMTMNAVDVKPNYGGRSLNVLLAKELEDDGVKNTSAANWDHNNKENNTSSTALADIANKENEENHECPPKVCYLFTDLMFAADI